MRTSLDRRKRFRAQFPGLYFASIFATKEERKRTLLRLMKPNIEYKVEELIKAFEKKYNFSFSRITTTFYLKELEQEGKVKGEKRGKGGTWRYTLTLKNKKGDF